MNWIRDLFLVMIASLLSFLFVEFVTRYAFPKVSPQTSIYGSYGTSEIGKNYGKSCDHGASLKNNQPRIKDDGIPKYSNEAILLAEINRYA